MAEVHCMYCGKHIPDNVPECPHCGAPSHFQTRGNRPAANRRFIIFFIAVTLFCLFMVFWLPR
jgi:ABC-type ATPase with predicted acetyltransferase domain